MNALGLHIVLVGFMGAGKSTIGADVASRVGRPFHDVDEEIEATHGDIGDLFARRGETAFREIEAGFVRDVCSRREPSVVALGGGAVETKQLLEQLDALVVFLDVDVSTAWERVRDSRRPLARDESAFRARYEWRRPLYEERAHARAVDADGVVLAAAGIRFASRREAGGDAVVADERVAELHGIEASHLLPAGEDAKTLAQAERLWRSLELDRDGTLVALGGGSTTDVAGFVAGTYMRGIDWVAVPSTVVGQVDAAIGGKTAVNLPDGKNLVGTFHWPSETVLDAGLLDTLPDEERANGLAEIVKSGLLAGKPFWELPFERQIRAVAAFKATVCLRDPFERGERAQLNLGHTFAHALEAASGYALPHGRAVALGLLAALRLSGLADEVKLVEELLQPSPVRVDPQAAWDALLRDKKGRAGVPRFVLLDEPGKPRWNVEIDEAEARAALDALIE